MTRTASEPGIALIGLRGTGKSTVGRLLAERLGRPFADADGELEARAGRTIRDIFAEEGEAAFRDWEERIVAELTRRPDLVLATGGGVVLRAANRVRLKEFGIVVWLSARPADLAARLRSDPRGLDHRPALTAAGTLEELATTLHDRAALYQATADEVVDTAGASAEEVAATVLARLDRLPGFNKR